jgi:protocatechuate 3,4-dioxygenase beta subunit
MWFHTEHGEGGDKKRIFFSTDGSSWGRLGEIADVYGDPMGTWFVKEYNISKFAGAPNFYIMFKFETTDFAKNFYAGWFIDDILVDDSPSDSDVLLVDSRNLAPKSVEPWFGYVPMLQLNLSTNTNEIQVSSIRIDFSGSQAGQNSIAWAELWWDNNGIPEPGKDSVLDTGTPAFPISFNVDLKVNPVREFSLFIVFFIEDANPGDWIGISMANQTYITVEDGDIVSPANFPIDTYVPGERTEIAESNSDKLLVEGWNRAPATAEPAENNILMLQLNLTASQNIMQVNSVTFSFSGTPYKPSNIGVTVYLDFNGNDILEYDRDILLGSDTNSPYTIPFALYTTPETPLQLFMLIGISLTALPGEWIGIVMPSDSSIDVGFTDVVSSTNFPVDTYVPGAKTQIVSSNSDTLTVTNWQAKNPATVEQGTLDVLMVNLTVEADANSVAIWSIDIDMKGVFAIPCDVSAVKLYHDLDNNGFLNIGADKLLSKRQFWGNSPPTTELYFGTPKGFTVEAGTPENLLIVYDISPAANIGDFIGVSLVNETYITFHSLSIDTVASFNFPIETNPDTEIIASSPDTLTMTYWLDNNPPTTMPGNRSVPMANMTFEVDTDDATIESIDIDLKGSPSSAADISSVKIYHDANENGLLDEGIDELLGFNAFQGLSPSKAAIILGPVGFTVSSGSPERLLIIFNISPLAIPGDYVGVSIQDETHINLHPWSIDSVSSMNFPIETVPDTEILDLGHISGTVVDENGEPLQGATVTLTNSTGLIVDTATTNSEGEFSFHYVVGGIDEYNITVEKIYYNDTTIEKIDVSAGETTYLGMLALVADAVATGRIIDGGGFPIIGAQVELMNESSTVINSTSSDNMGDFSFEDIHYGIHTVRANASGYQNATIQFTIDKDNLNIVLSDLLLTGIGTIMGNVVDENIDPLAGCTVKLYNSTYFLMATAFSDSSGNFSFSNVAEGVNEYSVVVSKDHYLAAMVDNIDVSAGMIKDVGTLILQTNATISGNVVDSEGSPIAGANVAIFDESHAIKDSATTDDNGSFAFSGLDYGLYVINASAVGYFEMETDQFTIDKNNLNMSLSSIVLMRKGSISGKVVDASGDLIINASVELLDGNGNLITTTTTNSSGEYSFIELRLGNYTILVNRSGFLNGTAEVILGIDEPTVNIPDITLTAISEPPPDDGDIGNLWWIILVVLIIVILVMVYLFVRMRGKKPEEPESDS